MQILIKNIKQMATPLGSQAKKGMQMNEILVSENIDILISNGKFLKIGRNLSPSMFSEDVLIDGSELVATPSFVDPHTHIPFYGFREKEFYLRQKGANYLEILRSGGGILETTRRVRAASLEEMVRFNRPFVHALLEKGVVVFEGKSGYGLDLATELKQLEVLRVLEKDFPGKIVKTFLGAHAIPAEFSSTTLGTVAPASAAATAAHAYIDWIIDTVLPILQAQHPRVDFVDIFCEKGVFDYGCSEKYLQAMKNAGFRIRMHADEIVFEGGSVLGARIGAFSVDHLIAIETPGIQALSESDTVATLLPGTSLFLDKPFARARTLIDNQIAIALGSDFNPGSCTIFDPTWIAFLAASKLKMTANEILTAQTLNAAASLGLASDWGSLEEGKSAGLLLWDVPDYSAIPYLPGHNRLHTIITPQKISSYTSSKNPDKDRPPS